MSPNVEFQFMSTLFSIFNFVLNVNDTNEYGNILNVYDIYVPFSIGGIHLYLE